MPTVRMFAALRVAAGTGRTTVEGTTVADVVNATCARYGEEFTALVQSCRVWRNGEPANDSDAVGEGDEVAILPPVSGGAVA